PALPPDRRIRSSMITAGERGVTADRNGQDSAGSGEKPAVRDAMAPPEGDAHEAARSRTPGPGDDGRRARRGRPGHREPPTPRDASVNSWNATSLLDPALAKNTLWAVVDKDPAGALRVQQDDQQWDQVVWVTAAWHHYLVTGDRGFLENAYRTAADTLAIREHA